MSTTTWSAGMRNAENPRVYFDMSQGGASLGRIVFELYKDVTPKTAENFRVLARGDTVSEKTGRKLAFKGCGFHRVIKDFMIQGGDFTNHNGTGGESIYGEKFEDENFELKHDKIGLLSMVTNSGPATNGSQFFITTSTPSHLDGKHVVFGQVLKGMNVVRRIENTPKNDQDAPLTPVIISDCGELSPGESDVDPSTIDPEDQYEDYPEDFLELETLEDEQKIIKVYEVATHVKGVGTGRFKKGDNKSAIDKWQKVIRYLDYLALTPEEVPIEGQLWNAEKMAKFWSFKISCLNNIAMAELKLESNRPAINTTTKIIGIIEKLKSTQASSHTKYAPFFNPSDLCKALYRRGQAHTKTNEFDEALTDLQRALKLSEESDGKPDVGIVKEIAVVQKTLKERKEKERKAYGKMFA
ncbi:hypothetical protein HK098_008066 [Nowakowskiella sp. JEL0407]|nr:hypothetical protein HK098_008066 [Nowakowskiella sp. JEL0407]